MTHEIIQIALANNDNLIHVIADKSSKLAAVVDPAWDAQHIKNTVAARGYAINSILITHSHHDHVNAVAQLAVEGVNLFVGENEYLQWRACPPDALLVADGDIISLGASNITVYDTPGHTVGGCCYHVGDDLISGDTLFIYGCGRADLPGGDVRLLYRSLQKIKKLAPQTRLWVGHNYSVCTHSTLGEQFAHNPFLMIDNEEDFIRFRTYLNSKYRRAPFAPVSAAELAAMLAT